MRLMCSAFAVLLPLAPALAQEKHTLRLKFVPGHVAHSMQSQDMTMNMAMGEQKVNTTMSIHTWAEAKTTEVKDGVAVIEQTYRRVKAKADGPGMKVDYDSDVADSKPGMLAAMGKMVGQKVTVKVDSGNQLKDVAVPEDLDIDLERVGVNLKEGIEQSFTTLPADPIAVGESWTTTRTMPMGQMGTMQTKVTNKLIEVKDNVVTIELKMEMDRAGSKLMPGMKVELIKAEGVAKIDLRNGMPVDMTMDLNMKMGEVMTMSIRESTKQVEAPAAKTGEAKPADAPKTEPPKTGGK